MIPQLKSFNPFQKIVLLGDELGLLYYGKEIMLPIPGERLSFTAEFQVGNTIAGRLKDGQRAALSEQGAGFFYLDVEPTREELSVGASVESDMA